MGSSSKGGRREDGRFIDYAVIDDAFAPLFDQPTKLFERCGGAREPTSEILCRWLGERLSPALPALSRIVCTKTATLPANTTANERAMKIAQLAQMLFIVAASFFVYGFGSMAKDGEARRVVRRSALLSRITPRESACPDSSFPTWTVERSSSATIE